MRRLSQLEAPLERRQPHSRDRTEHREAGSAEKEARARASERRRRSPPKEGRCVRRAAQGPAASLANAQHTKCEREALGRRCGPGTASPTVQHRPPSSAAPSVRSQLKQLEQRDASARLKRALYGAAGLQHGRPHAPQHGLTTPARAPPTAGLCSSALAEFKRTCQSSLEHVELPEPTPERSIRPGIAGARTRRRRIESIRARRLPPRDFHNRSAKQGER